MTLINRVFASIFSFLFFTSVYSQDLTGYWQGVLYQPGSTLVNIYPFMFYIEQDGMDISGFSEIRIVGQPWYGIIAHSGSVQENTMQFLESEIIAQVTSGFIWCLKNGTLTYDEAEDKLTGPWQSTGTCAPGTLEVYRTMVLSETDFCIGDPVQLEVSGQNIKWYGDGNYGSFLGAGNVIDLDITVSTPVYYSLTFDNVESPLVAIQVNIVSCQPVSVNNISQNNAIIVAPNPMTDKTTVLISDLNMLGAAYKISTVVGAMVASGQILEAKQVIDLSAHPPGIYLLTINIPSGQRTERILKL